MIQRRFFCILYKGGNDMGGYQVYKDIGERTNGLIYLGVVGPVRTGKSTFIKRFMDLLVIPNIQDVHSRELAIDELPQSAQGKTIMTTEPKFIPKEGVEISFGPDSSAKVRLIDCVGFMVDGAAGHIENEKERLVKTPWFEHEIPFTQAAEIGTQKVIREHSTIGIVITTDGSFGELPRENYRVPEEKTISELKKIGKPFVVVLNTNRPYAPETKAIADDMRKRLGVEVLAMDCDQLKKDDITRLLESMLSVFPLTQVDFYMPQWVEMLEKTHPLKITAVKTARQILDNMTLLRDVQESVLQEAVKSVDTMADASGESYIRQCKLEKVEMETGVAFIRMDFDDKHYYRILSDMAGMPIEGEYQLISTIRHLSKLSQEYEKVEEAYNQVHMCGYGVVTPTIREITMEEPEVIRHGNKFGVKIRANAPSVHMIKANIETEIAPIVGSEQQAQDLIKYIQENGEEDPQGVWETNIFGKSVRQLVNEGIDSKVHKLTDESRMKLQEAIQKVINDSNGGLVCIII